MALRFWVCNQRGCHCSAAYALRPYLYLLLHTIVAGPAALWFGSGTGERP